MISEVWIFPTRIYRRGKPGPGDMEKQIHSKEQKILLLLLRELREQAGVRQVDLAKKLKRHQSFVSKFESGERRLDILELREICKALGVAFAQVTVELDRRLRRA